MAKGFKFPLQKVLDIRKDKEDEAVRALQSVQKEKLELENTLQQFKDNYTKYSVIKNGESVVYQKLKRSYLQTVTNAIQNTEMKIEIKDREVNVKREQAKVKQIERKTVEILKEKKYESFIKEEERVEQITNDEFALYAHIRRLERG
ncbi:flagellar FliJ protein [Clostridium cavendishii DSM 21758]|uniref:Flagellar FliJ protein n=1 Tax=Clostridium cavendishii DSM 21758 TaxID=1121302 RepID=A0A1M6AVS2_9CLOT|nr:flagellar export protein FliJ [Clostridium cavendishii]SHI40333.1 flagellar FliJ protein [Clostridium cavendishii DSM 21758]